MTRGEVSGLHADTIIGGPEKTGMTLCIRLMVLIVMLTGIALPAAAADAEKRERAERLVTEFWERVWSVAPDLDAIDDLVVVDFVLTSAGQELKGRDKFKAWVEDFQGKAKDVRLEAFETFANADATRVTSRWQASGFNNGVLGTEPDGRPISFTGIAIWEIRWTEEGPKLAQNWVERSAWELYQRLTKDADD